MTPISADKLPDMIGKPIHLSWAQPGDVWILDQIEGNAIHLHSPRNKLPRTAKASEACYVRQYEPEETAL